jgi:endoglucanase
MRNLTQFKGLLFSLAVSCFLPLFSASTCLAALLVDDCEGANNQMGGGWSSYVDAHSYASPIPFKMSVEGYQSGHCARLEFEMKTGVQYPYAGMNTYFKSTDVSQYEGVRFRAKGAGNWTCQVPIPATATEYNHFAGPFDLTEKWTLVEVPFSSLSQTWGTPKTWDATQVTGVQWSASGSVGAKGWICVDNVEFYKKDEAQMKAPEANNILPEPKVNQLGYLPDAHKYFVVSEVSGGPKKGDAFRVLDNGGKTALSGGLKNDAVDDKTSTGEKVFQGDFSELKKPGLYTVEIGGLKSQPFEIKKDLYRPIFKDALRCFYTIRCGTAIDDKVVGLKHEACHMKDAPSHEDATILDLTGGWHNADDYGKWVLEESLSCSWMLWLYEFKEKQMADLKINIPESGNKMSDLLNQARWGLDWMMKMQRPDGGVLHKVDGEDHFCTGTPPEKDPYARYSKKPGTIDAGDFIGTMCLASRAYRKADPAYADKCLKAARKAWKWLEQNPNVVEVDSDYKDTDPSQEKIWALGEMARTTGDKALLERFEKEAPLGRLKQASWMEPQFFGYMALCFDPKAPAKLKESIRLALAGVCDNLAKTSEASGYGVAHAANEYWWESNENLLNKTNLLLFGYEATGDLRYREAALRQMNWLLGGNSLGFSFVTGEGENSVKNPWHWISHDYGKLMPGWVSGGPNQYPAGADSLLTSLIKRGTPPAKCYVDANTPNGSWASNEGETSENASLVFAAGYLSGE